MAVIEKIVNMKEAFEASIGFSAFDLQFKYRHICEKDANVSIRLPFVGELEFYVEFKRNSDEIKSIKLVENP